MATTPGLKHSVTWIVFASVVGFLVPAVFSSALRWERPVFLVPCVAIAGGFLFAYFRRAPITFRQLVGYWPYALIGIAAASFLLLRNIYGQPMSAVPEGFRLILVLASVGVVYGTIDGLLLNLMPALAVLGAGFFASRPSGRERLVRGLAALSASIVVTVAYHLGYVELHGAKMVSVIIGNIITSAYLLTGSPLAAVVTHVIMHVAAALHGMETTLQLPPHYAR
jgi:hypothetical protein